MILPLECPLVVSGPVPFQCMLGASNVGVNHVAVKAEEHVQCHCQLMPAGCCRYTAACSRSLVIKQCLQLPVPSVEGGAHTHGRVLCSSCTA